MKSLLLKTVAATAMMVAAANGAWAESLDLGTIAGSPINGSWNWTLTEAIGIRTQNPSCALTGDPSSAGCGATANTGVWSPGDNGNLNYHKGQLFTAQSKATTELLLHAPAEGLDFLGRGTFFYDPAAQQTQRTDFDQSSFRHAVLNAQLLDLWVSKKFDIADHDGRIRVGNQVINWGESLFLGGGINATNALDVQKSLVPGTQIKEYVLPAPIISIAGNVAKGLNAEAYYQVAYNKNVYPAIGSYWSVADFVGPGIPDTITVNKNNYNFYGLDPTAQRRFGSDGSLTAPLLGEKTPRNDGQWGTSLHYKPEGSVVDWGLYYLHYHDKAPVLNQVGDSAAGAGIDFQASYREDRDLIGLSTNFPLGDWALGAEFAYRPRDAIALSGCFAPGQKIDANTNSNPVTSLNCPMWKDKERHDLHLTALLQLSPTDYPYILNPLGAETAFLSIEVAGTHYTGIKKGGITQTVEGKTVVQLPDAGYTTWLDSSGLPRGVGSEYSAGAVIDFNWTYDGSLIPGWQVTPGITYFNAFLGNTPNFAATYLQGAQSTNFYILFNQNPAVWQGGINYTAYYGGQEQSKQPYSDRNFIGAFISRNF